MSDRRFALEVPASRVTLSVLKGLARIAPHFGVFKLKDEDFSRDPAFVELTTMVAVENLRSRLNSAMGLRSQGFSDNCAIPTVTRREGSGPLRPL